VLGLASNNAVTGVLSGVTKNVLRAGLPPRDVTRPVRIARGADLLPGYMPGPALLAADLPDESALGVVAR
jgi:hypothetical protein